MARMIKVLLLGAGGNVSQGILKAVRNSGIPAVITGACISPYSNGLYMCDDKLISPYAADSKFIPWLINTCNEREIDIILTGTEENITAIADNADLISERTEAVFVSCTPEQLKIGNDKYLTCLWLKENGCNFPDFCLPEDIIQLKAFLKRNTFPLLVKPRVGKGSSGIRMVNSEEEADAIKNKGYVLQEYVGDAEHEYTVGCYCTKYGIMEKPIVMKRKLKNGTTCWAKVLLKGDSDYDCIVSEAENICSLFKPVGPLNLQMRTDGKGRAVCFEINVRFSGTTAMRDHFGFKDVRAMLKEYVLGETTEDCFNIIAGEAFRYDEELYLPSDSAETFAAFCEKI